MSWLKLDIEERLRIRSWRHLWKTWDNTWISFLHHSNQFQTSIKFLFRFKVELMFLLAILNGLKSFRWYFLMFANSRIYWKVELLQHVNMKYDDKFYWYVKSFHLTTYWQVVVLYFNPTISTICKHHCKIISQGNIHHVWNVMSIVSKQDWGGCIWE